MFPTHVGIARRKAANLRQRAHVPYACGDCAACADGNATRAQCSLRMWGLRDAAPQAPPTYPMFPTHVGIARRRPARRRPLRNVPYACGDCAASSGGGGTGAGCSLRMWGLRAVPLRQAPGAYMFPTHVGIARPRHPSARVLLDVPYACGDCANKGHGGRYTKACSLRMWGLRARPLPRHGSPLMFPTHVGIARAAHCRGTGRHYVPYACGDCADYRPLATTARVCSLRMWGLRESPVLVRQHPLMFPTHVGIARVRSADCCGARYVPYACGDCADADAFGALVAECSLRMWGLRGRD